MLKPNQDIEIQVSSAVPMSKKKERKIVIKKVLKHAKFSTIQPFNEKNRRLTLPLKINEIEINK